MSHSRGLSVAAAAEDATRWLGIDLQRFEGPSTGSERLFLHLEERAALDSLGSEERDDARLRLWTVKEALFKSDPENESAWIGEYFIDSPLRLRGTAHRDASAHFRWACGRVRGGWLSAALRTES